ncbi:hypothetical protein EW146_g1386 [Bondarzewia mesenterica]|uniref:Uncharacterized protein n=1 Tax=Bondarzewia mesenterica TaxID=1095465 RepID=A0A4S4M3V5_9AGAM|nr:hypothetical protein EW146_g1386 [Bondarzewia mesenterica]
MAARRLAISSLLCSDDSSPPSTNPSRPLSSPDTVVLAPHLLRPRPRQDHSLYDRPMSPPFPPSPSLKSTRDFVPLSLQSDLRRHTPSPDRRHAGHMMVDRTTSAVDGGGGDRTEGRIEGGRTIYHYDQLSTERQVRPEMTQREQRHLVQSPYQHHIAPQPAHTPRPLSQSPSTPFTFPGPPSLSPPSQFSVPHRTSSTSTNYAQRASASPVNYYHPSPSPLPATTYHRPQSSPRSANHHRPELGLSTSSSYTAIHQRPSSTSFSSALINPVSPSMPSPLGGLEALVQAATEERRRINGESLSGVDRDRDRRIEGFCTSASRSPEVPYRPADHVPQQHRHSFTSQPPVPLSPVAYARHSPNRASPERPSSRHVDDAADQRPHKRRRRSRSQSVSDREREHGAPNLPVEPPADHRPPPASSKNALSLLLSPMTEKEEKTQDPQSFNNATRGPVSDLDRQSSSERRSPPRSRSKSKSPTVSRGTGTRSGVAVSKEDLQVSRPLPSQAEPQTIRDADVSDGPTSEGVRDQPQDQDVHDMLLDHFKLASASTRHPTFFP